MSQTVIVNGLAQLQRDIARSGPAVSGALRDGLRSAAEPVALTAERFALDKIGRMHRSPEWAEMRVGITTHAVYIAPQRRGVKSRNPFDPRRRPNLFDLLLGRSMEPALDANAPIVETSVNKLLGGVFD